MKTLTAIMFLTLLNGCTFGSATLADGTKIKYFDLHPAGNAVEVYAEKEGAIVWVERDTADSTELVVEAIDAATPGLL